MVRQAHGQPFDEWQQAHDPTCLLIVELKPALPFRVQSAPVEGLTQLLHAYMYVYTECVYAYMYICTVTNHAYLVALYVVLTVKQ